MSTKILETTFQTSVIPELLLFKAQTKLKAKLQILNKHNIIKPKTPFGKDTIQISWWLFIRQGQIRCITTAPSSFIYVSHIPLTFETTPRKPAIWNHWTPNYSYPWKAEISAAKNPDFSHQGRGQQALREHSQDWWSIKRESNCCSALRNSKQLHTGLSFSCILPGSFHQV